jgi:hypothetical protein
LQFKDLQAEVQAVTKKKGNVSNIPKPKKEMKLHGKDQTIHSPMSKSRSKFKAVPKKKEREGR